MTSQRNLGNPNNNFLSSSLLYDHLTTNSSGPHVNSDHLTLKQIQYYCQDGIVRATLAKLKLPSAEIDDLATWVKEKAKRIFLLLVYNERLDCIGELRREGLIDDKLPMSVKKDMRGNTDIHDRANQRLNCFSHWGHADMVHLVDYQWYFMAWPFTTNPMENNFHIKQPLEIDVLNGASAQGGFGHVYMAEIPFSQDRSIQFFTVAVKYVVNPFDEADPVKFYNKERVTLETMRQLDHPHLIQAHASFQRRNDRGFIFPWAAGGSLLDLWLKQDASLNNRELLAWALTQMEGVCDGIAKLHAMNTRHGDLKPANILSFPNANNRRGELRVADVGLAKFHREYTEARLGDPTTAKYTSWKYAPPEASLRPKPEYSRKYDMWCFGCVLLEFLVWLALGRQQLQNCFKEYKNGFDDVPFWEGSREQMQVSGTTIRWIEKVSIALDEAPSQPRVLRSLLDLIKKRLLRITVANRANSQEALLGIQDILNRGKQYPSFHSNLSIQPPAKPRMDDVAEDDSMAFSKSNNVNHAPQASVNADSSLTRSRMTSNLKDSWEVMTDNQLIRVILPRMKLTPSLPESIPLSKTCQACTKIDFRFSEIHLTRNLDAIRTTSKECAVCSLLDACLSTTSIRSNTPIQLFQRKFSLGLSRNGPALVSLYSEKNYDPEKLPYPQVGVPWLLKVASPQQFVLLRQWIRLCDEKHQCTSPLSTPGASSIMPTRVIHVGTADQKTLRLIESSENLTERYIALSHCWGKAPPELSFRTTKNNVVELLGQIDYDSLPQTFRDAVIVARSLGIQFLWIDSLCIIQDDHAEWESESAKMGDYYSSAYVTIAATSAKASTEGFLLDRADRPYATVPLGDDRIHLAKAIDNFEADVESGPLNTRAWVLQERALSRRTIHFTSTQVYWECGRGVHCETLAQLRNPQSQFLGDHNFPTLGLGYYKDERVRLIQHLHKVYTAMHLSFGTDRPIAIAGLHSRLESTFQSRMDYGVFWRSFERSMLWRADDAESLTRITYSEDHSVPSWSWMAFNGKIGYIDVPFGKVDWTGDLTNPFTGSSPRVNNKQGILANARKVVARGGDLLRTIVLDAPVATDLDEALWRYIAIGKYQNQDKGQETMCCVLLIRPVFGGSPELYERAGVGSVRDSWLSSAAERVVLI